MSVFYEFSTVAFRQSESVSAIEYRTFYSATRLVSVDKNAVGKM